MKRNKNIFIIALFEDFKEYIIDNNFKTTQRKRINIGFYDDKNKAVDYIIKNAYNINSKKQYPYILIDETPEGIYGIDPRLPLDKRQTWFEWSDSDKVYKEIKNKPILIKK